MNTLNTSTWSFGPIDLLLEEYSEDEKVHTTIVCNLFRCDCGHPVINGKACEICHQKSGPRIHLQEVLPEMMQVQSPSGVWRNIKRTINNGIVPVDFIEYFRRDFGRLYPFFKPNIFSDQTILDIVTFVNQAIDEDGGLKVPDDLGEYLKEAVFNVCSLRLS